MIQELQNTGAWDKFLNLLPEKSSIFDAAIPKGTILYGSVYLGAWVPDDDFLNEVRIWLAKQEQDIYYFLLEGVKGEESFFSLDVADLTEDVLEEINPGYKSVLTNSHYSWVISSDADKVFHIAGSQELFDLLKDFSFGDNK